MFRKIGLRTIKTALSIGLGMLFYILLRLLDQGLNLYNNPTGFRFSDFFSPFFAGIAAAYSLYPSKKQSIAQAKNRVVASLLGGVVGIILTIGYGLIGKLSGNSFFTWPNLGEGFGVEQYIVPYILVTLGVLIVVILGNLFNKKSAIFVGILTFISVTINPMGMIVNRYNASVPFLGEAIFGCNRILSTVVGVLFALAVNLFKLPRRHKNKDMAFYIGIGGLLKEDSAELNGFFKYKLIDAYERNIPCSIFTTRAPMTFMHLFNDVNVRIPVCCMSGAALFDPNEKKYLYMEYMEHESEVKLDEFFKERNIHPFKNYIFEESHIIVSDEISGYNEVYYNSKKHFAYCNIIKTSNYEGDLLYYLYLDTTEKISQLVEELKAAKLDEVAFILINNCYEAFGKEHDLKYLKIYSKNVEQLKGLKQYLKDNNMRLTSFTSQKGSNYLLEASDYKVTFDSNTSAITADIRIKTNSYEEIFSTMKKMYYSKKYEKKEV